MAKHRSITIHQGISGGRSPGNHEYHECTHHTEYLRKGRTNHDEYCLWGRFDEYLRKQATFDQEYVRTM